MLDSLESADFSPYLNQPFRICAESLAPIEAKLIEVTDLGSGPAGEQEAVPRQPFSIVLRGPGDVVLPQRIYRVEHEEMGTLDLFLVPIGPDARGMRYEAIFA
jgi:hypothetical protein